MRVRSELELRRAEAQRLGEERAPQTVDGVVGRGEGRAGWAAEPAERRTRRRRRSRRLALEALDEVLENGIRRDVELHLEAGRVGEVLQEDEVARVRGRDPGGACRDSANGNARKRRLSFAGRHSTMSGSEATSVARETPGRP